MKTFLFIAISLITFEARAAWTLEGESVDHTKLFIESNSLKIVDGLNEVLVRMEGAEPKNDLGFSYSSIVELYGFDCPHRRYKLLSAIIYSQSNMSGTSRETPIGRLGSWRNPNPKTTNEKIMGIACGGASNQNSGRDRTK